MTVIAEDLAAAEPDTRYEVRLIQFPRPSSTGCAGGDSGVVVEVLATDAAGAGRITLRDVVDGDTTGACSHGTRPIRWRPP